MSTCRNNSSDERPHEAKGKFDDEVVSQHADRPLHASTSTLKLAAYGTGLMCVLVVI